MEDPTWILPGLCTWVKVSQYLLPSPALSWNVNVKTKAEKYILPYNFGQSLIISLEYQVIGTRKLVNWKEVVKNLWKI